MKKVYITPKAGNLLMASGTLLVTCSETPAHEDAVSFSRENNGGSFWDDTE